MTKKRKPPRKPTKTAPIAARKPAIDVIETAQLIAEGKHALRDAVHDLSGALTELGVDLKERRGADHDKDGWSHHAWLTKNVAQVVGEVRKLDATERATSNKITVQQVLAFARELAPIDREGLVADIQAIDEDGSVL